MEEGNRGLNNECGAWYPPRGECEDLARCSLECWPLNGDVN